VDGNLRKIEDRSIAQKIKEKAKKVHSTAAVISLCLTLVLVLVLHL
jgi:hypothetical protein